MPSSASPVWLPSTATSSAPTWSSISSATAVTATARSTIPPSRSRFSIRRSKSILPLWEIYADDIGATDAQAQAAAISAEFEAAQKQAGSIKQKPLMRELPKYWNNYFGGLYRPEYEVETGLSPEEISELTTRLTTYPDGFHIHPKVKKLLEQRAEMGAASAPSITAWPKPLPSPAW